MAWAQKLGEPGGNITPQITSDEFNAIIEYFRHPLELYQKSNVIDCTCYNEVYESVDPDCPLCQGTGNTDGWTSNPKYSFLGVVFLNPEGNQDQHQRLYAKPGPVDTQDGRAYVKGNWYKQIRLDDIIIWRLPQVPEGIEFIVIGKNPRFGQYNEIIFVRLDVTRTPVRRVGIADDIERSI